MRTVRRTHKHRGEHTLNCLGSVPLSASLTLRQTIQARPAERKRVGEGEREGGGKQNRPKQPFTKHFTCLVTVARKALEHDLQTNHPIVKHFSKMWLFSILLFSFLSAPVQSELQCEHVWLITQEHTVVLSVFFFVAVIWGRSTWSLKVLSRHISCQDSSQPTAVQLVSKISG